MATMARTVSATMISHCVDTRFLISHSARCITDQDGTVILNVTSGKFHSLVSAGSLVWRKLMACPEGVTVETIVDLLRADGQFVVEPRIQIDHAVQRMLNTLVALGVVYRTDQPLAQRNVSFWIDAALFPLTRLVGSVLLRLKLHVFAAFLYITIFYVMIKMVGFGGIYQAVKNWPLATWKMLGDTEFVPLCEAVDRACVWFPKQAMCLARSVVATCLLRQSGIPAVLVIAAQKNPFKGHAWTEVDGIVVNDNQKVRAEFLVFERI